MPRSPSLQQPPRFRNPIPDLHEDFVRYPLNDQAKNYSIVICRHTRRHQQKDSYCTDATNLVLIPIAASTFDVGRLQALTELVVTTRAQPAPARAVLCNTGEHEYSQRVGKEIHCFV